MNAAEVGESRSLFTGRVMNVTIGANDGCMCGVEEKEVFRTCQLLTTSMDASMKVHSTSKTKDRHCEASSMLRFRTTPKKSFKVYRKFARSVS